MGVGLALALPGPGRAIIRGWQQDAMPRPGSILGCSRAQQAVYIPMETLLCCCFPKPDPRHLQGASSCGFLTPSISSSESCSAPAPPPRSLLPGRDPGPGLRRSCTCTRREQRCAKHWLWPLLGTWHATGGPCGCSGSKLPAAWGVLAECSAESSADPGRAAIGRCQTLALEHPLASHQSWQQHRSQQWQSHTCGWGWSSWMWDQPCPPRLAPPHQRTVLGGLKIPTSLVGSAHPTALAAISREQLQPHQLGTG